MKIIIKERKKEKKEGEYDSNDVVHGARCNDCNIIWNLESGMLLLLLRLILEILVIDINSLKSDSII
jgi:hypothetical protein